jgi:hypothetical protein
VLQGVSQLVSQSYLVTNIFFLHKLCTSTGPVLFDPACKLNDFSFHLKGRGTKRQETEITATLHVTKMY